MRCNFDHWFSGDNVAYIQERKVQNGETNYRVQVRLKGFPI